MTLRGFWSYSREDDKSVDGTLVKLCEELTKQLNLARGEAFDIFRDEQDIGPGERWEDKLEEKLVNSDFLIPVLTPGYLKSEWCRREFETFHQAAQERGQEPMVFPIQYKSWKDIGDHEDSESIRQKLKEIQLFDFQDFVSDIEQDKKLWSRETRDKINDMATRINRRLSEQKKTQQDEPTTGADTRRLDQIETVVPVLPVSDDSPEVPKEVDRRELKINRPIIPSISKIDNYHTQFHSQIKNAENTISGAIFYNIVLEGAIFFTVLDFFALLQQ